MKGRSYLPWAGPCRVDIRAPTSPCHRRASGPLPRQCLPSPPRLWRHASSGAMGRKRQTTRWRGHSAASNPTSRARLSRRHVYGNGHHPADHHFGVGHVEVRGSRPVKTFQVFDQVELPVSRDPPVHLLDCGRLITRIGEQGKADVDDRSSGSAIVASGSAITLSLLGNALACSTYLAPIQRSSSLLDADLVHRPSFRIARAWIRQLLALHHLSLDACQ